MSHEHYGENLKSEVLPQNLNRMQAGAGADKGLPRVLSCKIVVYPIQRLFERSDGRSPRNRLNGPKQLGRVDS